jgi:isoleucyl-tRNA synthetase
MKLAAAKIAAFDDATITTLLDEGKLDIVIDGETVGLTPEDLEIASEELGEWSVAQQGRITVALDTHVTAELLAQGFTREVVNRIQGMRKSADLELTDRIRVEYCAEDRLKEAIDENATLICRETLSLELVFSEQPSGESVEAFDIGNHRLTLTVSAVVAT